MTLSHLLGFLAVFALVAPAALAPASAGPGEIAGPGPIVHGEGASYDVSFPQSGLVHGVAVEVGEAGTCKDALARPHECVNLTLTRTHGGVRQRPEPVGFSRTYGEVLRIGTWDLALRHPHREAFVAEGPRWYASPLAAEHDAWPSELMNLYRVALVGAVTVPLRYHEDGPGPLTLAGTPGTLHAVGRSGGGLEITGVFRHEIAGATYAYSYAATLGPDGGFPDTVVLEELLPRPHVIATAHRTSHTHGNGTAVRLDGLTPAPASETWPATYEPWASHPPDGASPLLFPLREAAAYTGIPAAGAAYPAGPSARYVTFANYREAPAGPGHGDLPDLGVPSTVGRWFLWEPVPAGRVVGHGTETGGPWIVTRERLQAWPPATLDTLRLSAPLGAPWSDRWVPAREDLAPTAIRLSDGIAIARTLAPHHPHAFELKWEVTSHPAELGTPWESTLTLECGTQDYPSSVFVVVLSATTGQLLSRTSWGHDACYVVI